MTKVFNGLTKEQYIAKLREFGEYDRFVEMGFMRHLEEDQVEASNEQSVSDSDSPPDFVAASKK